MIVSIYSHKSINKANTPKKRREPLNMLEAFRFAQEFFTFEEARNLIILELTVNYEYTDDQAAEAVDIFLNRHIL